MEVVKSELRSSQSPNENNSDHQDYPKCRKVLRFPEPLANPTAPLICSRKTENNNATATPSELPNPGINNKLNPPKLMVVINELETHGKRKREKMEATDYPDAENANCPYYFRRRKFKAGLRRLMPVAIREVEVEPMDWVADNF